MSVELAITAQSIETERLYGKDAHCPDDWTKWFNEANVIPSKLLPEGPNNLLQCLPQSVCHFFFCSLLHLNFILFSGACRDANVLSGHRRHLYSLP